VGDSEINHRTGDRMGVGRSRSLRDRQHMSTSPARPLPQIADRHQWVILAARRAIVRCDDGKLYTLLGVPKGKGHRARLQSQDGTTAHTVRLGFVTSIEHIPTTQGEPE
jgi:hypothetical protein